MPDERHIPTVEWRARPTMAMMTCLRRLEKTNGRLTRIANGFKVAVHGESVLYWFSTVTGNGIVNRGMVDALGYISKAGRDALERYE